MGDSIVNFFNARSSSSPPQIDDASRWPHVAIALVAIIGMIGSRAWPDLWKDQPTAFATIGFFVTAYGVAFAIVELLRTKAAAVLAASAARAAEAKVASLYDSRNAVECQTLIEGVLERLQEDGTLSSGSLSRIVRLYAAEFSDDYEREDSRCRRHVGMVSSFALAHGAGGVAKPQGLKRLREALLNMVADLAVSNDRRLHKGLSA